MGSFFKRALHIEMLHYGPLTVRHGLRAKLQTVQNITGVLFSRRNALNLQSVQTVDAYLDYCKLNNVLMETTVFRGTLYELLAKSKLEQLMNCYSMTRVGGSGDNGLDVLGRWNLANYNIDTTRQPKRQLILSKASGIGKDDGKINLQSDIVALVQCKSNNSRIKASTIRELAGIYEYHVKTRLDAMRVFFFLVSPHPLTKQAQSQVDTSKIPIIHVKMQPMTLGEGDNAFDVKNWTKGSVGPVYMNPVSCKLLEGLDVRRSLLMLGH